MEATKQQTAVEWLENEIFRRYKFTLQKLNCGPLEEAIQQAKAMEKEQIIDAYNNVSLDTYKKEPKNNQGTKYYTETYETKDQ